MPARTSGATAFRPPTAVVDEAWLAADFVQSRSAEVAGDERAAFDELAGAAGARLILFGAGNLGRRTLAGLRKEGLEPQAFADNAPSLAGRRLDGLDVLSPDEAVSRYPEALFIVTIWTPVGRLAYPDVAARLSRAGGSRPVSFVPLYWKYAERFLPYHCLALPHLLFERADLVKEAYARLADAQSRHEFRVQLSYLLSDMTAVGVAQPRDDDWYFPRDLVRLRDDEVFVDCGAYDGDSLLWFVTATAGRFAAAYAFEPDPGAAERLAAAVATLPHDVRERVVVERKAVAATSGVLRFAGGGTPGSHVADDGGSEVTAVSLDDALGDPAPTFIKMDVEGAEADALAGARALIERVRPILAICVYHLQDDLERIVNALGTMCPDYELYLRRLEGDLVCFAIPEERSLDGGGA